MGQKSSFEYLPEEILTGAIDKIDNEKYTQMQAAQWVNHELAKLWEDSLFDLSVQEREILEKKLSNPHTPQAKVIEWLNIKLMDKGLKACELKVIRVSKSAFNRYWLGVEKDRRDTDIAREAAAHVLKGSDNHKNDLGKALNEQIKTAAFNIMLNREKDITPKQLIDMLSRLSGISKRVAEASKHDSDRIKQEEEQKIRREERNQAIGELQEAINEAGLSEETGNDLLKAMGVNIDANAK